MFTIASIPSDTVEFQVKYLGYLQLFNKKILYYYYKPSSCYSNQVGTCQIISDSLEIFLFRLRKLG